MQKFKEGLQHLTRQGNLIHGVPHLTRWTALETKKHREERQPGL